MILSSSFQEFISEDYSSFFGGIVVVIAGAVAGAVAVVVVVVVVVEELTQFLLIQLFYNFVHK